ncbi:uncharacterized protein PG986_000327 [Apiospora aurea]|uniref:Methyltransferase type 11 domain-containing protein n=1 Tax=Apiospora aurea TaxID=335848 RepID=A0ABR1QTT1_9PEZI
MSTVRARSSSRGRSSDEMRSRRMGGVMETSREDFSPALTRNARKEASNVALTYTSSAQPKTPSRIPQTSSTRKPSTSTRRPPLTHESQAWSSGSNSSNIPSTTYASHGSASSDEHNAEPQQPRRTLRRKQSSVSRGRPSRPENPRTDSGRARSSSSIPRLHDSPAPRSLHLDHGMEVVPATELPKAVAQDTAIYPELDRYRGIKIPVDGPADRDMLFRLATHDLPPPTPLFSGTSSHSQLSSFSGSPSTRFSDSPGAGPYSRDTTPTSMSSASPGLVAPYRNCTPRLRHASPAETRPPVSHRRAGSVSIDKTATSTDAQGLAPVRETSLTSSSSNSTVRGADDKEEKLRRLLPPAPPNPPPRKVSQKLRKVREPVVSPYRPSQDRKPSIMRSPSPAKSPFASREGQKKLVASPPPRGPPPARPSREGTPDLAAQFGGPLPVIQSNLSTANVNERRQSAQVHPSSLPRSATPSDRPGGVKASISREPTPAPRSASSTGFLPTTTDNPKASRTPSPGASAFRSRFGLFGRRTKTETSVPQIDKKDKLSRKGPAAGTGHEGYGRMGTMRRRSSNTGNPPRGFAGAVSSSESLASAQSTDPFLLERMNPVVIAGGEIVENRNASSDLSRTESNQSLAFHRPSLGSRNPSSASLAAQDEPRNTLWPSAFPRRSVQSRRPSDSSDSEALAMKSTLAYRRSVQRLRSSPDQEPLRLPKPIVTRAAAPPSQGSIDTTTFTDDSSAEPQLEPVRGRMEAPTGPKKLTKRVKSPRKWNLFSRSQDKSSTSAKKQQKDEAAKVSATVKPVQSKPVPFYAIMDSSEQEDTSPQDMTTILREAEVLPPPPSMVQAHERRPSTTSQVGDSLPRRRADSRGPAQEKTQAIAEPPQAKSPVKPVLGARRPSETATLRPSRLPQVGRIPKVVNTRPEQTSPKSFSRPFHRVSMQHPSFGADAADQDSVAKGPSPPRPATPELMPDESTTATAESASPKHQPPARTPEFLVFPPRTDSEFTTSTTSSGSGILAFAYQNTVAPEPVRASLAEDEIWDEYNDLLGDVPPSATSSRGIPFHLETYESKLARRMTKPLESPTINVQGSNQQQKPSRDSVDTGNAATNSSHYSADMTARLNAAFRFPSDTPTTPFSVSEFVSGYGDRNNSMESNQPAVEAPERTSTLSDDLKADLARAVRVSDSSCSSEETPLSQVNLRVGSMTVSKWLSFGHVLFSPTRDELIPVVGSLKRHSILVLDGLGNDDWSFYAAETYPAATFFNLSPRAPISAENRSPTSFPLSPPNHHQIQYLSYKDKLPFGPDSFTTVVFRFPSAAPESHYRNIISEARRVLKPGGYIELSILDVDLVNMGNRTRRAVRRLKERVHMQHPDYNLSSSSDLILRLLAKKGFGEVKTCRVGVPVASAISSNAAPPAEGSGKRRKKDERSLAEMMNDETETGDENITKMVAKVGRWWYNRLYESAAASKNSIWNDKALLAECEEWGTSLKLMVCHARTPETRTRVSSI